LQNKRRSFDSSMNFNLENREKKLGPLVILNVFND
jgi:hypothetical protein